MFDFLSPETYRILYLGLVTLLVLMFTFSYQWSPTNEKNQQGLFATLIIALFFVIYFGFRPTEGATMGDTAVYATKYNRIAEGFDYASFDLPENSKANKEVVWKLIMTSMANSGYSLELWFTVVAIIYMFFNIWGIIRIMPNHIYPAFLFFISFFLFYTGGINGIRTADAYSIVFFAITLYKKPIAKNYILMALLFVLGYLIHSSLMVTIGAFILARFFIKDTKLAILIWFMAIIISLLFGNTLAEYSASIIDDNRAQQYLNVGEDQDLMESAGMQLGFRWDFLIFSALPIVIGWYVVGKRQILDPFYKTLLNTYILANAVWVIFIYAGYSNRFAMLSWCLYPYVLCYPYMNMKLFTVAKQSQYTCVLLWIQLLFTVYMSFK